MTTTRIRLLRGALVVSSLCSAYVALAQDAGVSPPAVVPNTREYSRTGELSPGTAAPTVELMVQVIQNGSPEKLHATLEYGERVACIDCVPLLEDKLLSSGSARVREISAWWLRRQPFAGPAVLKTLKQIASTDPDATRRSRAAEALGEFMDPFASDTLVAAAKQDADVGVRASAVRALARLNYPTSGPAIAAALADAAPSVRGAALDSLLSVVGYADFASVLPLLADPDPALRAHAARICGEVRYAPAESTLEATLAGDGAAAVRKVAAWALGRIGSAAGQAALAAQKGKESDPLVLGAIDVAQHMPARAQ